MPLNEYVDHVTILVPGPPEIVLAEHALQVHGFR